MISTPLKLARPDATPRPVTRRQVTHHRVLGLCVPGLAAFERPGMTCVAVVDVEQAVDLVTALHFDLMLVGGDSIGPELEQLMRSLRATRNSPRWVVVSTDEQLEIRARAMGAVAMVTDIHDPRLLQLIDTLHAMQPSTEIG